VRPPFPATAPDSLGMADAVFGLPEQLEAALGLELPLESLPAHEDVEQVVVVGMGGSGLAGDVLLAVAGPFMSVPATVVKSYELPDFVGRGTLVFAVSHSGQTEETVEAAGEALAAGAWLVAVTEGGSLATLAEDAGAPVVRVPPGIPQPRAAIGALSVPPLVVLERLGLFPGATRWVELAINQLRRRRQELAEPDSIAALAARRIGRTIPLVHGAQALGHAAALRFKTQVNENAKAPAFFAVQPELCHNEVAGFGQHGDVTRQLFTLVQLRHDAEHPQVQRRFALVSELLAEVVSGVVELWAEGEGDLAQLFDLFMLADVVSLHLAANEGVDPGPVPVLGELKARLAEPAERAPWGSEATERP
jgi:glucose/mannose-6-phosphate isomerase